jgi:hypothetical protein
LEADREPITLLTIDGPERSRAERAAQLALLELRAHAGEGVHRVQVDPHEEPHARFKSTESALEGTIERLGRTDDIGGVEDLPVHEHRISAVAVQLVWDLVAQDHEHPERGRLESGQVAHMQRPLMAGPLGG